MTKGQEAYEEDVRRKPFYWDDRERRTPWEQLPDYVKATWEKNPTPRDYGQTESSR